MFSPRCTDAEHHETLTARGNLFWDIEHSGRYADALEAASRWRRYGKLGTARPEVRASNYTSIGVDYGKIGHFEEAEAAIRKALAIWAALQGSNDEWDSADPMLGLAEVQRLRGNYVEAEKTLRHAIAIEEKHEPPSSGWLNRDRGSLGD